MTGAALDRLILLRAEPPPLTDLVPGAVPIASCHFMLVADLLARRGCPGFEERLGLAWGCQFLGSGVLFGSMTWNAVLAEVSGATVSIERFVDQAAARAREIDLSAQGLSFAVEVDEFYLPGYPTSRHVVHAINVLERSADRVRFVDPQVSPTVHEIGADEFDRMRAEPCAGRVEPFKLYALTGLPLVEPTADTIVTAVRNHLQDLHPRSMTALAQFAQWAAVSDEPIDTCRVAGERFQAAKLFRFLGREGVDGADAIGERLASLADEWYIVHMLGTNARLDSRRRDRVVRLLTRLADAESDLMEMVVR